MYRFCGLVRIKKMSAKLGRQTLQYHPSRRPRRNQGSVHLEGSEAPLLRTTYRRHTGVSGTSNLIRRGGLGVSADYVSPS